jgi:hypothetical protein
MPGGEEVTDRCDWCGVLTPETLCRRCMVAIDHQLSRCEWLDAELQINVTRQSQTGSRFREGGRSGEKPLVFDDGASEGAWVLQHTLEPWAVSVRDMILASPADPSTSGQARWLRHQIGVVARLDDVADLLGELNAVVGHAFGLIDVRTPRVYLGDCTCGQAVYGSGEQDEAYCWKCRQVYRTAEWREANAAAGRELLVTIREASLYLGEVYGIQATAQRMRRWVKHLTPRGVDAEGVAVYRLGDLLDHARNTSNEMEERRVALLRRRFALE